MSDFEFFPLQCSRLLYGYTVAYLYIVRHLGGFYFLTIVNKAVVAFLCKCIGGFKPLLFIWCMLEEEGLYYTFI